LSIFVVLFLKITMTKSAEIFDHLFLLLETKGIDETIKALQEAASDKPKKNFDIDFVLSVVSQVTGVDKKRIIGGNDRTDDRKIAVSLCVYFVKEHFNYSLKEMEHFFNKGESALSRYNQSIERRPNKPKTDFDKRVDTFFKKVNLIISEKKINS